MSSIKYRPEIDGLRTLAVLPVLLFHLGCEWIPGGFLGVDVFFVISGYLITAIILKDFAAGRFSLKQFWIRRVRRIFPVLSIMVIATLTASFFISFRPDLISFGKIGLASIFSFSNIALWKMSGSYWGTDAESSPFLHTWSLAVEEQFYIFYPVILFFLLKAGVKKIGLILMIFIGASFLLYLYGAATYPTATFYLLPTRAWELGVGCLIAVLHHEGHLFPSKPVRSFLSATGLFLILFSYLYIDGKNGLNALQALSVIGSGLILINDKVDGFVNRMLSLSGMVYVGKISYSLYLWHWPVIVLLHNKSQGFGEHTSPLQLAALMIVLALLSYYFVERTTRKMVHVFKFTTAALVISTALSAYFVLGSYRLTYETEQFETVEFYAQQYDLSPTQEPVSRELALKRTGIHAPPRNDVELQNSFKEGGIVKNYGNGTPEIVVLGDSHAQMWSRTIDQICEELKLSVAFNTMIATNPFIEIPLNKNVSSSPRYTTKQKYEFNQSVLTKLGEWKPSLVIVGHRWEGSNHSNSGKQDLLDYIGAYGGRVLLLEQPPVLSIGNTNTSMFLSYLNLDPNKSERQYIEAKDDPKVLKGRQTVRNLARQYLHVEYFKVFETFASGDGRAWILKGKTILYYDDDHLSNQGAMLLKEELKETIRRQAIPKAQHSEDD